MPEIKKPEEMSLDELRDHVLAELNGPQQQDEPAEQPRDEHGRFTKPAEDEEIVYQRTIDLHDGAGVQVFEGKTMEELVDKLAKAQENATRKIREQATELKNRPAPLPTVEEEKKLTPEEQWLLTQRMQRDPMSVINEYVTKEVTKQQDAARQAAEAERTAIETAKASTDQWVESNPDYYASPKNGKRMEQFLRLEGLELNPENLTKAFTELSTDGLLEARPAEASNTAKPDEQPQSTQRIVEPTASTVTTVRRKVVGGISTKRSAPAPTTTPELDEKQLYDMPLHELEQLMYRQARG